MHPLSGTVLSGAWGAPMRSVSAAGAARGESADHVVRAPRAPGTRPVLEAEPGPPGSVDAVGVQAPAHAPARTPDRAAQVRRSTTSTPSPHRSSHRTQNPAGESAVADETWPPAASSSANAPPRLLPATCGWSSPSGPKNAGRAAAISAIPDAPESRGDPPNPGTW